MIAHEYKDTLISVKDVSLKFGSTLILKSTSVDVRDVVRPDVIQGQVIGILGPSGVGKTQFARILAGLQKPTTGQVLIERNSKLEPVQEGLVGFVFQNYQLFEWRTVLGNLLVALEKSGLSKNDRKVKAKDYLEKFNLLDKADLFPSSLSGGQRQRVAIIQQLLCSDHFIVMDEPTTGLDPLMKEKVCGLINKVAGLDEKNTIFVIAHDIESLISMSDTLWLFGRDRDEKGQIIPGATIKKSFNLIERGLAWDPGIASRPEFHGFVDEVKAEFRNL